MAGHRTRVSAGRTDQRGGARDWAQQGWAVAGAAAAASSQLPTTFVLPRGIEFSVSPERSKCASTSSGGEWRAGFASPENAPGRVSGASSPPALSPLIVVLAVLAVLPLIAGLAVLPLIAGLAVLPLIVVLAVLPLRIVLAVLPLR